MPLKIYRRPGEDIWQYTGTVAGRRIRGSAKTTQKSEAQRKANEVESRELQRGRDPGSVLTFADAAIEYRKMGKVPKYLEMVEDHWKDTPVRDYLPGLYRASVGGCSRPSQPSRLAPTENEMTEIPEDVMKLAQAAQDAAIAECKAQKFAVYEYPFGTGNAKGVLDAAIARAILAEREACAARVGIALLDFADDGSDDYGRGHAHAKTVAMNAIRKG